jgi:tRNA(His) 5'-end guanylyltransferase
VSSILLFESRVMKLGQAVASFAQSAMVRGTFAESFYKGVRLDRQEGSSAYFKFTVPDLMCQ